MIITFFRSSSFGTHSLCPHKFLLEYSFNLKFPAGKKADLGNICHKVFETLGNIKLHKQKGLKVVNDKNLGKFPIDGFTVDDIIDKAYKFYVGLTPFHDWCEADLKNCRKWVWDTLSYLNGEYNPLNRNIIDTEKRFEIVIDKPWADYDYRLPNGKILRGRLGLKGTIDLVTGDPEAIIEILDWKTGSRTNFPKSTVKEFKDFVEDPQFLMYTYAARRVYVQAKEIILTVFYCRDGGPFTLPFSVEDDDKVEWMLRRKFNEIRNTKVPQLHKGWWCKVCPFANNRTAEGATLCEHYEKRVRSTGIDKIFVELDAGSRISDYGEGGGRKA